MTQIYRKMNLAKRTCFLISALLLVIIYFSQTVSRKIMFIMQP